MVSTSENLHPSVSAWERLCGLARKFKADKVDKGAGEFIDKSRRVELADGTTIRFTGPLLDNEFQKLLGYLRVGPKDRLIVDICKKPGPDKPSISFSLDKEGLARLCLPLYTDLRIANVAVTELNRRDVELIAPIDVDYYVSPQFKDIFQGSGGALVDWVEKMTQKGQYSEPPISITPRL